MKRMETIVNTTENGNILVINFELSTVDNITSQFSSTHSVIIMLRVLNVTAILQWDRLMSKSNIFNRNHRNPGEVRVAIEYSCLRRDYLTFKCVFQVTSDTSISVRIAQKLRKEIEDEKKSKKFLEKDVHDMKVKINSLKAETIEKVVSKNVIQQYTKLFLKSRVKCVSMCVCIVEQDKPSDRVKSQQQSAESDYDIQREKSVDRRQQQ